jgi:cysteine desulfurase/selenocysteine lyase
MYGDAMQKNDLTFLKLKKQFKVFDQKVNGHPLIYFDSASTSQTPQSVVDAMVNYYSGYKANIGRGIYHFAEQATLAYEQARQKAAHFIGAKKGSIIFT